MAKGIAGHQSNGVIPALGSISPVSTKTIPLQFRWEILAGVFQHHVRMGGIAGNTYCDIPQGDLTLLDLDMT